MERSLIESFVHPSKSYEPSFDFMLNTHLMKNVHFRPHNYQYYFLNFFLGFALMIPETSLETDLGIKRTFVKIMPEKAGIKFVFFLDNKNDRVPSMEVRNVFFVSIGKNSQRGLNAQEYKKLRDNMMASKRVDIDKCNTNLEEYFVTESKIYSLNEVGDPFHKKMDVIIKKLKTNRAMICRTIEDSTATDNELIIMQRLVMGDLIDQSDWPNPLEHHLNKMVGQSSQDDRPYQASSNDFFDKIIDVYQMSRIYHGISYKPWSGADCGFMHGSLIALSSKLSVFIQTVIHDVQPGAAYQQFNADMLSDGIFGRFYLVLNPKADRTLEKGTPGPMVLSFVRDLMLVEETIDDELTVIKEISGQYSSNKKVFIVPLNFDSYQQRIFFPAMSRLRQNNDPVVKNILFKDLVNYHKELLIRKNIDAELRLISLLEIKLNSIQLTRVTQDINESTFVSRHILGELMWTQGQLHDFDVKLYISNQQATSHHKTTFLMQSSRDHTNIILKFIENPMLKDGGTIVERDSPLTHEELDHLQNGLIKLSPENQDTLIITIEQHFQHTRDAFLHSLDDSLVDFINRKITVGYVKFEQYKQDLSNSLTKYTSIQSLDIDHLSHLTTTKNFAAVKFYIQTLFERCVSFIQNREEFRAIVNGLFYHTKHLGTIVELKSLHSQHQIALILEDNGMNKITRGEDRRIELENLMIMNFMYSKDKIDDTRSKNVLWTIKEGISSSTVKPEYLNIVFHANGKQVRVDHLSSNAERKDCSGRKKRSASSGLCSVAKEQELSIKDTQVFYKIPKLTVFFENLGRISHYIMSGVMLRDFASDIIHGDFKGAVKDGGFVAASFFTEHLATLSNSHGFKLANSGKFLIGNSFKIAALILRRLTSAYVISHLISSIETYHHKLNDTSALVNIGIDSAFLGIDAIETGVEVMELFGLIQGISSITGPIGTALGAFLIVGANVYETVKKIDLLNKEIHLTMEEEVEETFRSFLHLDVSKNVETVVDEHKANQLLMDQATQCLKTNTLIKYYIGPSGTVTNGKIKVNQDSIIDLRKTDSFMNSRANPKETSDFKVFCHLAKNNLNHNTSEHVEKQKTFWEKISLGFRNFIHEIKTFVDYIRGDFKSIVQDVTGVDPNQLISSYLCHKSFGITNEQSLSNVAYFQFDFGYDQAHGFVNKTNIFHMKGGHKVVYGGDTKDIYVLQGNSTIVGILDGQQGYNVLDISQWLPGSILYINNDTISYQLGNQSQTSLLIANMNEITGRSDTQEIIDCSLDLRKIDSKGGLDADRQDAIRIKNDTTLDLTVILSSFTAVENNASFGNFTYVMNSNAQSVNISIHRDTSNLVSHKIQFLNSAKNLLRFSLASIKLENESSLLELTWKTGGSIKVILHGYTESFRYLFTDGVKIFFKRGHFIAILKTNMTLSQIAENYDSFLQLSGLTMVAYSTTEAKSIMFNHGRYTKVQGATGSGDLITNILHNDPIHESRIVCANSGKNVVIIKKQIPTDSLLRFYLPTITIDCANSARTKTILDFSPMTMQLSQIWPNLELFIEPVYNATLSPHVTLLLSLLNDKENKLEKVVGIIILYKALDNSRNYKIINYGSTEILILKRKMNQNGELVGKNTTDHFKWVSSEFNQNSHNPLFPPRRTSIQNVSKDTTTISIQTSSIRIEAESILIYLTAHTVERRQIIEIAKNVTNYQFYRLNQTLVITNVGDNLMLWDVENACTIVLENFFQSVKLKTLTIRFQNELSINMSVHVVLTEIILDTPEISELWSRIIKSDKYFYKH